MSQQIKVYPELKVSISARFPLPVHKSREYTDYHGTYAFHWNDLPSVVVVLPEPTLDGVVQGMKTIPKPDGADAVRLEATVRLESSDGSKMTVKFGREIGMDLHTYISEDGKMKIQYRSDYGASDGNVKALLKAAAEQGLKEIRLVSVVGSVHHHTLGTVNYEK